MNRVSGPSAHPRLAFSRRGPAALLLALALQGCGGGGDEDQASVQFKPDAATCAGDWRIAMYIDGSLVGTETLRAGTASSVYRTAPGTRVLAAVAVPSGLRFTPVTVDLAAGDEFLLTLGCR